MIKTGGIFEVSELEGQFEIVSVFLHNFLF